jgi:hypothetical protein
MAKIANLSAALVALLALGAFILSYSALYETAREYGVFPPNLRWIWPLLIDFALVVFSLAVLRANLLSERAAWPWVLVGLCTVATVAFNLIHAPANLIARLVAVVAPAALFLSFETLMSMLKSEIRRRAIVASIADLRRQSAAAAAALADQCAQQESLAAKLASLRAELAELRREKRQIAYTGVSDETRAAAAAILSERSDISGGELGRLLGRSGSTGRKLKRELLPLIAANGHGPVNGAAK